MSESQPALFYPHPYELDAEEPFDRLRTTLRHPFPDETWKTRLVRLSQGLNRGKTKARMRSLLADFEWTSGSGWRAEQEGRRHE